MIAVLFYLIDGACAFYFKMLVPRIYGLSRISMRVRGMQGEWKDRPLLFFGCMGVGVYQASV